MRTKATKAMTHVIPQSVALLCLVNGYITMGEKHSVPYTFLNISSPLELKEEGVVGPPYKQIKSWETEK